MSDPLVVLDPSVRQRGLQSPASVRGLVVLVHPDSASRQRSGQRFIADVLRANGLETLVVTLHPPQEQRAGLPPPGQVQVRHRLQAVFDWLAARTQAMPVALLGVDDAVRGCVAAAARYRPAALRSLILLDGHPHRAAKRLALLPQPTLMIVGACGLRSLNRHRAALRQMTAPSRLEVLALATQPQAAAGAHQAVAHAAMRWLETTLWPAAARRGTAQGGFGPGTAQVHERNTADMGR